MAKSRVAGFTLIEVLMIVALIAILALASMDMFSDSVDESKYHETKAKLEQLRIALVGDPAIRNAGVRTSFGIFGDLGGLPAAPSPGLGALTSNSVYPAFAPNSAVRLSLGWSGPYLSPPDAGASVDTDAWGTTIQYNPSSSPVTLISYAADRAAGGVGLNEDITVSVPSGALYSTVSGFICDHGGPFDSQAEIEINYPDGTGNLRQDIRGVTNGDKGYFSFPQIPFGVRSISVYLPSQASVTQKIGPVVISVDTPNYTVPCDQIDINP